LVVSNSAKPGSTGRKNKRHDVSKTSNVSVAVENNLNNYVDSKATVGDLNATLIVNTIDNNVNINSPSNSTNSANWNAPVNPDTFFPSGWSNIVRGQTDVIDANSTDAGHRRLSNAAVQGLLNEILPA
jgi:hypothetical protein